LPALFVHLYTASGAAVAFFGTAAVLDGRYRAAFLWMFAATLIDATDGVLARRARVNDVLPRIDGARLDDIVDYLTFVFLPVVLMYHSGALPGTGGSAIAAAILVSSAFGFAFADAKTDDHFFTGFPSYWNIVALYLHVAGLGTTVNAAILLVLSAMVFWRVRYVYPTRTPALRTLTIVLGAIWTMMVLAMILQLPAVSTPLVAASAFFPLYYFILSAVLHLRTAGAAR
jgi:phosphatidylcholine synthase